LTISDYICIETLQYLESATPAAEKLILTQK